MRGQVRRWGEVRVLVVGSTVEDNDATRSPYNKATGFSLRKGNVREKCSCREWLMMMNVACVEEN